MPYPSGRNPREIRSYLHNVYDRYASGEDMFPSLNVAPSEVAGLPRKTRPIARALSNAWLDILMDGLAHQRDAFYISARIAATRGMQEGGTAVVAGPMGRNAFRLGMLSVQGGEIEFDTLDFSSSTREMVLGAEPHMLLDSARQIRGIGSPLFEPPSYAVIRTDADHARGAAFNLSGSGYVSFDLPS